MNVAHYQTLKQRCSVKSKRKNGKLENNYIVFFVKISIVHYFQLFAEHLDVWNEDFYKKIGRWGQQKSNYAIFKVVSI